MYTHGVAARKAERAQAKEVKELRVAGQVVPPEKLVPIPDPEKIWKAGQAELHAQEEQRRLEALQEGEDIEIVIDTTSDQTLQHQEQDYIQLPSLGTNDSSDSNDSGDSDDSDDSDESEIYDSEKEYSWNHRH
jgi:hypothetical protein